MEYYSAIKSINYDTGNDMDEISEELCWIKEAKKPPVYTMWLYLHKSVENAS